MRRIPLILIIIILAILPFFWMKPGEVNLGGDSSRLYFYDPINYLKNFALYSISPSQTGEETISYFFIPFTLFLAVLKSVFSSTHLLINIFHSFMLVTAFLSVYLIIIELIKGEGKRNSNLEFAAILGGLFYALTPVIGFNWDKALVTHNQVFLNPLIFFLLLRYVQTTNIGYPLIVLLVMFIFAPNFSFISAPPFFAFYPFALLYLFLYAKFIRKTVLPWKASSITAFLVVLTQAFHLIPQLAIFLDKSSNAFQRVFSSEGISSALQYFKSVSPSIKLTNNLLALPQTLQPLFIFEAVFFTFLVVVVWGLFLPHRNRNFLLLTVFFLVTLFFDTANITPLSLSFYEALFNLPGFGMFKNFFGQFMYVFYFFYALVFGHALYYVLTSLKNKKRFALAGFVFVLLIVNGWPFIKGKMVNLPIFQTKDIKVPFKIDPEYEKLLEYIRKEPTDSKFLTLPLTDFGYQLLAGKEGGVYIGPSMIGYLAGKKDFPGSPGFGLHGETLLNLAKGNDYQRVLSLLSQFNIRYIFHNTDPRIYDTTFLTFPYDHAKKFLPENQASYKEFMKKLNVKLKAQFSDKYYLYEMPKEQYLPHIYVAKDIVFSNRQFINMKSPTYKDGFDTRLAQYNTEDLIKSNMDIGQIGDMGSLILDTESKSIFWNYATKRKPSRLGSPFVSRPPYSRLYPLVVLREKIELSLLRNKSDKFLEFASFLGEKRVKEINRWQDELTILGNLKSISDLESKWVEPTVFEFKRFGEYNSWEVSLLRYQKTVFEIIKSLKQPTTSKYPPLVNKLAIKEMLVNHKSKIDNAIKSRRGSLLPEKLYLLRLSELMFDDIQEKLDLRAPEDSSTIPYIVQVPMDGVYEVYVEKEQIKYLDNVHLAINVNGRMLTPQKNQSNTDWVKFGEVPLIKNLKKSNTQFLFTILKPFNLVDEKKWEAIEAFGRGENSTSLVVGDSSIQYPNGLIQKIPNWQPNSFYLLSFDYLTYGKTFRLRLYEKEKPDNPQSRLVLDEAIKSTDWKKYEQVILSGNEIEEALIQLAKPDSDFFEEVQSQKRSARMDIRDVSLIPVPHPRIVLLKSSTPSPALSIPKISFKKVNPTKYKVQVTGATSPYTLVFLDEFNQNWGLFNTQKVSERFQSKISSFVGGVLTPVVELFLPERSKDGEIVESYFGQEVQEKSHENAFLDINTFETWGKDPIAESGHILINGYANGWYIKPEDVDGRTDYELVMEMTTQKKFYGAMVLTLFGLGVILVWLAAALKRSL